jgi:hypothetical protein
VFHGLLKPINNVETKRLAASLPMIVTDLTLKPEA